jgi:hypothetical protein
VAIVSTTAMHQHPDHAPVTAGKGNPQHTNLVQIEKV